MDNEVEVLLRLYESEWSQVRQCEDQRAALTNILLLLVTAIIGVISQRGLMVDTLPLSILLIVLGAFGALATQKLYERARFHVERARRWRNRIDELLPNAKVLEAKDLADHSHAKRFGDWRKIRLHTLWSILHIGVTILGIVLTIAILTTL